MGAPWLRGYHSTTVYFHAGLPGLFRDLLPLLPALPARASKYRLCVDAWGGP